MTPQLPPSQSSDAFQAALKGCRGAVAAVVFFSLCINLLMLTAPLYMLQVFDRVLNSRSTETLMFLALIAFVAFVALVALGAVEAVRHQMLSRIGGWLDRQVSGELLKGELTRDLGAGETSSVQSLRDLATLRPCDLATLRRCAASSADRRCSRCWMRRGCRSSSPSSSCSTRGSADWPSPARSHCSRWR
jgi:ABC-type protease/lipase transport system fused ATPase/permease subunit